jgi:PAS domain S-box-containing protein
MARALRDVGSRVPAWLKKLSNTTEGVFVVGPDERILTWNKAAERLLGQRSAEVIGRPCYSVLGGRLRSGAGFCRSNCSVERCARRKTLVEPFDIKVRTPAHDDVWVRVAITMLPTERGTFLLHTIRDARERAASEEALGAVVSTLKAHGVAFRDGPRDGRAGDGNGLAELSDGPVPGLTRKEAAVLRLLAAGQTTGQIAAALGVSIYTIRSHIRNMLKKAGVHSRTELVALALRAHD